MAIVPGIDGGSLIQALSMGRRDRMAHEQGLLQQRAMQQQMQDAERQAERQRKIDETYADVFSDGGVDSVAQPPPGRQSAGIGIDRRKLRGLMALGPEGAQAAQAILKMDAEQFKAAQERMEKSLDLRGRIIGGIRALSPGQREGAYQQARQQLEEMGMDTSRLPANWDEGSADQMIRESMTAAEALGLDHKIKQFEEQVRHNRANESTAAGGLAVRRGALDLARQREGRIASGRGSDGENNSDLNYLLD